jgi:hypothetical protein
VSSVIVGLVPSCCAGAADDRINPVVLTPISLNRTTPGAIAVMVDGDPGCFGILYRGGTSRDEAPVGCSPTSVLNGSLSIRWNYDESAVSRRIGLQDILS